MTGDFNLICVFSVLCIPYSRRLIEFNIPSSVFLMILSVGPDCRRGSLFLSIYVPVSPTALQSVLCRAVHGSLSGSLAK